MNILAGTVSQPIYECLWQNDCTVMKSFKTQFAVTLDGASAGPLQPARLRLPPHERCWPTVRDFLRAARGLDPALLARCRRDGLLYADARRNAVFVCRDPAGPLPADAPSRASRPARARRAAASGCRPAAPTPRPCWSSRAPSTRSPCARLRRPACPPPRWSLPPPASRQPGRPGSTRGRTCRRSAATTPTPPVTAPRPPSSASAPPCADTDPAAPRTGTNSSNVPGQPSPPLGALRLRSPHFLLQ